MTGIKPIRIDKYLWAVRIFKTRSMASEACRKGRILINDHEVKASRIVAENEIITVKKPPAILRYKVIVPVEKRVSAKLAPNYIDDLTTGEEKMKLVQKQSDGSWYREKGSGRPTKKERRNINRLREDIYQ
ncbi:MAG: RNA-binding S4 domain-containing protein [Bacteroidales bacterium]|nr:RNA-binding S4 domain-containing protein [Bacteroidales bacterium]